MTLIQTSYDGDVVPEFNKSTATHAVVNNDFSVSTVYFHFVFFPLFVSTFDFAT